jgi:competence protein ComEC
LQIPENFEDFDYRMFLAKDGIFYVCKNTKIELIARDQGSRFYASILKIKNKFNDNINQLIPFPESVLLSGLILGGSSGLPAQLKDNFSRTGMTHIVAVSGYNVTIVANMLMIAGIWLGLWRPKAFWFAVFGILVFVLMTGLSASAVRAGVMGSLLLWAMKNGRLANSQNAIVLAAAIMLLINPLLLRYDIGFQLSFLATLGIVFLYPHFESKLNKNSRAFWLWEILFLSLSAQIFVLPIILYNFQTLSLISLVANVLILPIVPLTMVAGFLPAVAQFLFSPLAQVLAWLAYLPLQYEIAVVSILGNLKYAALNVQNFPWWGAAAWYLLLALFIIKIRKQKIISIK